MASKKTAVILIHGIGEQVPMETLIGFVDTVWAEDKTLVDEDKPDPNTGGKRTHNASWSKPDERNRSFELQVVTTESDKNKKRVDFFEYYWAHRVDGTTWEQVRDWIFSLLLRNPFKRVPPNLRLTWIVMWLIAIAIGINAVLALRPDEPGVSRSWLDAIVAAAITIAGAAILAKMVSHAGDIVRYVKAEPKNIVIRQSIRENGVRLLESLMGIGEDGTRSETPYDRIIVVGHSLGTIVGYDMLTYAFGRLNDRIASNLPADLRQPHRAALEEMVRNAMNGSGKKWSIADYRAGQDACRAELKELGHPWIVSDFVTLGSPLTHAEFLMARDREALTEAKKKRILPTCPPTLEYDRTTDKQHFTYRSGDLRGIGANNDPEAPRVPHHAAVFAYTRWTNIYSQQRLILGGDIVSGPVADAFGAEREGGASPLQGIVDVAVLPSTQGSAEDTKRRLFTHLKYWDLKTAKVGDDIPSHIQALRRAMGLGENR